MGTHMDQVTEGLLLRMTTIVHQILPARSQAPLPIATRMPQPQATRNPIPHPVDIQTQREVAVTTDQVKASLHLRMNTTMDQVRDQRQVAMTMDKQTTMVALRRRVATTRAQALSRRMQTDKRARRRVAATGVKTITNTGGAAIPICCEGAKGILFKTSVLQENQRLTKEI